MTIVGNFSKRFLFILSMLGFLALATVIQAQSTETECTTAGGKWCQSSGGGSYWCTYSTACPANTEAECLAQSGKWCLSSSGSSYSWCVTGSNATCPAYDSASCAAQNGKWCASSSGGVSSGWCSSDLNYTCPASTQSECTAQGGQWCTSTYSSGSGGTSGGTSSWCMTSGGGCPINDQATCESQSRQWCVSSGSSYGWCASVGMSCSGSYSGGSTGGTTTGSTGGTTTGGTGSTTGGTTTGNTGTTTDPQTTCTQGSGKWCKNSDGTGWCSYSTYPCPAYDTTSCTAQGGDWCPNSYGGGGWCAVAPSTCPINDKTTCEAKGRQWCISQYSSTSGSGWCTYSATEKCPAYTEADCKAQGSEWCPGTYGGSAWCATSSGCPINDQATCNTKGKYWCTSTTYSSSGWCTDYPSTYDKCVKGDSTTIVPTQTPTPTPTPTPIPTPTLTPTPGDTESECRGTGGQWCKNSDGMTGWCSKDKTSTCPVYTEADCKTASGKWCKNADGATGWCSYGTYACPAYDKTTCEAQKGEWCTSVSSGSATTAYSSSWCSTGGYGCPINDKTACEAKGRKWCKSVYGTSWCTGSATEKCPSDSEAVPVPTPVSTYGWPQSQGECVDYSGVWCTASYTGTATGGNCNMAGSKCPPTVPSGKVMCFDWFITTQQNLCAPAVTTKEGCQFKGGAWCENDTKSYSSTAGSSGWCNYSKVCPKYPPSGKMTCPDNETFVTNLTDCPRKSVIEPPKTTCQDGTVVFKGEKCPLVTCPDGAKVESGDTCPVIKQDQQIVCSKKGGVWCVDTLGKGRDYCSLVDKCVFNEQPIIIDTDTNLTPKEVKKAERQKSLLLTRLKSLEKGFVKLKDDDSLGKITELKDTLNGLVLDTTVWAALQELQEDVDLMREIYRDAIDSNENVKKSERDQKLEKLALAKIKKQMERFALQIKTLSGRIARFEKQKIVVPKEIKETIVHLNELFATIKETTDYDLAHTAAEEVGNLGQDLNAMLPVLEQLVKMPKIFKSVATQITRDDRAFSQAANVARLNKLDFTDELNVAKELLGEAKAALGQAKAGEYGEADPFDFIRVAILDKLEEAEDQIQNIQGFANIRRHVGQIGASINRSAAQIKRLVAKKADVAEAQALWADVQERYKQLKVITDKRLNLDEVDNILNTLDEVVDLTEKLEEMLNLSKPTVTEQELEQPLKGNDAVTPLNIPQLEETLSRSINIKNFFVRMPASGTVLVNFRR